MDAVFQLVRKNADGSDTVRTVGRRSLGTSVSSVSGMYRYYSLRGCEKDPAKSATRVNGTAMQGAAGIDVSEPTNMPDSETDPVYFAFVHGFNVDERESGNWQGRLFKRLYQTGANVRFVGIDWNGDEGPSWNYHTNAEYAFRTAGALKRCVTELASGGGKFFLLAHSLGNMLVSSAIADHGLKADGFFMLNAAVAAEAYDPTRHDTSGNDNPMVPPAWRKYPHETWSAGWHSLFDKTDDRSRLAWKGRFEAMLQAPGTTDGSKLAVYNYYDSEDEVIRTKTDGELALTSGWDWAIGTKDFGIADRSFAWQKQEFLKGRWEGLEDIADFPGYLWGLLPFTDERTRQQRHETIGATDEAGWGFQMFKRTRRRYDSHDNWHTETYSARKSVKEAKAMKEKGEEALRDFRQAVFLHNPAYMAQPTISQEDQDHLLAFGIPALSSSAGSEMVGEDKRQKDLAEWRKKAWPRNDDFVLKKIWAHSDFMLVPYFYTYQLYESINGIVTP